VLTDTMLRLHLALKIRATKATLLSQYEPGIHPRAD